MMRFFEVTICDLKDGGTNGKEGTGADNRYDSCCSGNQKGVYLDLEVISMTTNRMFGKMLSSRLLKVMSIIIVACMLVTLTACGTTVSQQDARQTTTEYSTVDGEGEGDPQEPKQTVDDSYWRNEDPTEEPASSTKEPASSTKEPTTEPGTDNPPTGSHTYTVYGDIQLTMDVDIDAYITTNNAGQEVFKLSHLAVDLGWWPDNINPDSWSFGEYLPDMFTCPTGDMTVVFTCHTYDYNAQFQDYPQISGFSYFFAQNGSLGTSFYNGSENIPDKDKYVMASINGHGADLQYLVPYGIGKSFMASRDDIVVLAYALSRINSNPGANPFFNTGLTRYMDRATSENQVYILP